MTEWINEVLIECRFSRAMLDLISLHSFSFSFFFFFLEWWWRCLAGGDGLADLRFEP